MIPQDVEIFVSIEPVNMHLGFDRLAGLVTEWLGRSARDPALYVFLNRRRTLLKALFFDGDGILRVLQAAGPGPASGSQSPWTTGA